MTKDALDIKLAGLCAVRTWHSDGGQNVMSLAAAVRNLQSFGLRKLTADEAAQALLHGEQLRTRLAVFQLGDEEVPS